MQQTNASLAQVDRVILRHSHAVARLLHLLPDSPMAADTMPAAADQRLAPALARPALAQSVGRAKAVPHVVAACTAAVAHRDTEAAAHLVKAASPSRLLFPLHRPALGPRLASQQFVKTPALIGARLVLAVPVVLGARLVLASHLGWRQLD